LLDPSLPRTWLSMIPKEGIRQPQVTSRGATVRPVSS